MKIANSKFKIGDHVRLKGAETHCGTILSMHYLVTRTGNSWMYRVAGKPSGLGEWMELDCESVEFDK